MSRQVPAEIIAAAQEAQRKYGVPAAVSIGQWALESGWGEHMPPQSNNPFGIKALTGEPFVTAQTVEYTRGVKHILPQNFRKFASMAEAFDAHAKLLATAGAYAAARQYEHPGQDNQFADALQGHYATDPHYGALLRAVIKGGNLTQYDVA